MRLFLESAMWHSALLGAVLLVVADYAAMRVLLAPFQIPVGLATGAVGGVYILWLLRKVR
ncbi:iron chelate uptake ABC transporter family permease subunit [Rothia aeria]|uniref:iron chelate uptake ABC transporter family permease subunit n=1 Tax=Rothia aeria TaxID=172042 RepID=UPI001E611CFE|nr:iron chelate uptake ABC transporter family permease subunit [Rothia aeria]